MKKLLIGLVVIVLVIGGGAFYLLTNLDSIAKRVIENSGTAAMGTAVRVSSVNIDLMGGNATLSGFTVANPEGFSNQDMMRFDELHVDIDIRSLNSDMIRINRVTSSNPYVLYEMQGNRSNLDAVRERFPPRDPDAPPPESEREIALSIGEILIEGIQGSLQADRLPRDVGVNLGTIRLENMEGTPPEIARQIVRPLVNQLSRTAAQALVRATGDLLEEELSERAEEAARELRDQAESQLDGARDDVRDAAEDAATDLRDRLGDALRRD